MRNVRTLQEIAYLTPRRAVVGDAQDEDVTVERQEHVQNLRALQEAVVGNAQEGDVQCGDNQETFVPPTAKAPAVASCS